jgi:hypothetical protein
LREFSNEKVVGKAESPSAIENRQFFTMNEALSVYVTNTVEESSLTLTPLNPGHALDFPHSPSRCFFLLQLKGNVTEGPQINAICEASIHNNETSFA